MLCHLTIDHIVLIHHISLTFTHGFHALTGETGAGKSILLDALSLSLGERAHPGLIRQGAGKASVVAHFHVSPDHEAFNILKTHDLDMDPADEGLILRRHLSVDGKSKAFINDHHVSAHLLKKVAHTLVDIHGQFDHLLTPQTHLQMLDTYMKVPEDLERLKKTFEALQKAKDRVDHLLEKKTQQEQEQATFLYAYQELEDLDPQEGAFEALSKACLRHKNRAKMHQHIQEALTSLDEDGGAVRILSRASETLKRLEDLGVHDFQGASKDMENMVFVLEDYVREMKTFLEEGAYEDESLESLEDRLFAWRQLARKHGTLPENLPKIYQAFQEKQAQCQDLDAALEKAKEAYEGLKKHFMDQSHGIRDKRRQAIKELETKVAKELSELYMHQARFHVSMTPLPLEEAHEKGMDKVTFQVQTNPGSGLGPLHKIASGGERSRIMLALKVILACASSRALIVFDEIDAGVGGAVADAIGKRLWSLSNQGQVLAITHAPQVAAHADHHWHIKKTMDHGMTFTQMAQLDTPSRQEELARMLSGGEVQEAARKTAQGLLKEAQKAHGVL